MDEINLTIIGAGVVGLAVAAELSGKWDSVLVLERHDSFGREISSRNSEVIHAGIYYPEGSMKAALCVEGAQMLYALCREHSIPHKRTGKLIVASNQSELGALEELYKRGRSNSAKGLQLLDRAGAQRLEPNANAQAAIYSPDTGIVDSHALMKHLKDRAESNGAMIAYNSEVTAVERENGGCIVGVRQEDYRFRTRAVINCAGLSADHVAALAGIDVAGSGYRLRYCKGTYFSYARPSPVGMLVYPVPGRELAGLGIHATLDLGGRLRFGPDVEYVDAVDYKVDAGKRDSFHERASRIIQGVERDAFIPDMAGIRPKLYGEGEPVRDFVITSEKDKGFPHLINLIGIESPGLTSSLAIARKVADIADEIL